MFEEHQYQRRFIPWFLVAFIWATSIWHIYNNGLSRENLTINISILLLLPLTITLLLFFFKLSVKIDKEYWVYKEALAKDSRLKYVAQFENGKASVGLQFIPKDHPFYNLEGKDNIVQFYTDRYIDQPLLIKGAGAGAAVTASGIFADVIRIGNI